MGDDNVTRSDPYKLPLPEDIVGLIERLQDIAKQGHVFGGWSDIAGEAVAALSRLTAPPLPEEIAGLLARVDKWRPTNQNEAITGDVQLYIDLADALRVLAQENERLKAQPLPDEIAGLFGVAEIFLGDTEHWELADDSTPDPTDAANALHKLRAALRALAQENERLARDNRDRDMQEIMRINNELVAERDFFDAECKEHAATIAACVVERDEWKMKYESEVRLVDSIEAESDAAKAEEITILVEARDLAVANRNYWQAEASAIRAKTFKDCAKLCDEWLERFGDGDIKYTSATKYASDAVKDIAEAFRVFAQTDEKIDTSDIPEKGKEWFEKAKLVMPSQGD